MSSSNFQKNQNVGNFVEDILKDCNDRRNIQLFVDDIINVMEGTEQRQNLYRNFQKCNPSTSSNCPPKKEDIPHSQEIESSQMHLRELENSERIPEAQMSLTPQVDNLKSTDWTKDHQVSQEMLVEPQKISVQGNNLHILVNVKYANRKASKSSVDNLPQGLRTTESSKGMTSAENLQTSCHCLDESPEQSYETLRPSMISSTKSKPENLQTSDSAIYQKYGNKQVPGSIKHIIHKYETADNRMQPLEISIEVQQPEEPSKARLGLNKPEFTNKPKQIEDSQIPGDAQLMDNRKQANVLPQEFRKSDSPNKLQQPKNLQTPKDNRPMPSKGNQPENLQKYEFSKKSFEPNSSQMQEKPRIKRCRSRQLVEPPQNLKKPALPIELPKPSKLQIPEKPKKAKDSSSREQNQLQLGRNTSELSTELSSEFQQTKDFKTRKYADYSRSEGKYVDNLAQDSENFESCSELQQPNTLRTPINIYVSVNECECMRYENKKSNNLSEYLSKSGSSIEPLRPKNSNIAKNTPCTGCDCMKPLFLLLQNQKDGSLHLETVKKVTSQDD